MDVIWIIGILLLILLATVAAYLAANSDILNEPPKSHHVDCKCDECRTDIEIWLIPGPY